MNDQQHPLDSEDVVVAGAPCLDVYVALARHIPTGTLGQGMGDTLEDAQSAAKDDLLGRLEVAGGC